MINVTSLQPSTSATEEIFPLILQLGTPHEVNFCCIYYPTWMRIDVWIWFYQRESALSELSKRREVCPEMAPILWYSFGTISVLLQEIIMVYPMLSPPVLSSNSSTRVCNALALLQCVASHPETKQKFMGGLMTIFLFMIVWNFLLTIYVVCAIYYHIFSFIVFVSILRIHIFLSHVSRVVMKPMCLYTYIRFWTRFQNIELLNTSDLLLWVLSELLWKWMTQRW